MTQNKPIQVLLVDDEERFRATTANVLQKRGFQVTTAANGHEALKLLQQTSIDVVVLDVKMPGMGGHEVLGQIRRLQPKLAVIMLTGHGTAQSALQGLCGGVFDYLAKPCDLELLAQKIHQAYRQEETITDRERLVREVMVPLTSYSLIREEQTVEEALQTIYRSFVESMAQAARLSDSQQHIKEKMHWSVLVTDKEDVIIGILGFRELLQAMQPPYMKLLQHRPSMADQIYLDPPSFPGLFTAMTRILARKKIGDLDFEALPSIDAETNLSEAANKFVSFHVRRLLVLEEKMPVGVLRTQDLFFEMIRLLHKDENREESL